jgi:hypothetical protein
MTWIAPIAIGGMILAAGPIIIHIIFRRRYRVVRFAAFQFLLENRKRTRQRIRIEELILILLRVLACCLLGFLLSDIRLSGSGGGAGKAMSHVFLLDDSLSMDSRPDPRASSRRLSRTSSAASRAWGRASPWP